ncbi:hypothetical protein ILUMI_26305 [Ignelater luminosus]|uniref:Cytochrome P450 n=1 Tax=Ignelater luminosus TaxID=2038154 RepID=A0A8K0C3W7_IGNLU|nr:hypothetical protein ILUMI_26305 [Ignelater luminosus]
MFNILVIAAIVTFLIWYIQYHWKRRKLYAMASKMNGPLTLPFIGNALYFVKSNAGILQSITQLCSDYKSPVRVWIGSKVYVGIWKPSQLEVILNNPHTLGKPDTYEPAKLLLGNGLLTLDVPIWKLRRKTIMPTFNQNILNDYVKVFAEKAEILVDQLKKVAGKGEFNIYDYINRCTLDTFCETSMGVTINAQTTDCEYMKWIGRILKIAPNVLWLYIGPENFIFHWIPDAIEATKLLKKVHDFTDSVVKEKRLEYQRKLEEKQSLYQEDSTKRKSFLEHLIELSETTGENFTDEELRAEVDTFMVAGSDTTASTDSYAFVALALFPEVQNKVYKEVLDILGPDKPVEYKDLGKFVYLERVLKETMRIFPVAAGVARSVTKDVKLENYILPSGSTAVLLLFPLHRDPEIWPDPLRFDPDRFLPDESIKRHPYSWLPFSAGPRNCIGFKYGMMSMKALIATVIRKYEFSTTYKNVEDVELQFDVMVKPVHGFKVSVKLRNAK